MRTFLRFTMLAVIVATLSCTKSNTGSSSTGGAESRGKIGFSALTLQNPFFKIIADNISEEAAKHGFEVIVNDADRDKDKQSKQIDNFIAQKVSAIIINPADAVGIGPAIKNANDAGIPVFTNDLQCVADGVSITGHIGTDNYQGGKLAGQAMIDVLGEDGGEVLVLHFKQANSCVLRVDGFTEVINAHNAGRESGKIEIVAELDGGGLREEGFKAASDALQAHPNLVGIFAINDPSAIGAYNALESANKQDRVKIVGFDGQLDGKQAIKDGWIFADPIQFPDRMGRVTVQNIVKYLDGEKFTEIELIPTELYTKKEADADPQLK